MVARPTASKGWRLELEHGRRRPAAGVTTLEQQRPVRQEEAATRHGHSRRRYVTDVRPTTSTSTTVATVVRHRNYLSSATRAQFQLHCVSVSNVNRLTELLRRTFTTPLSRVYLYSVTISSQLSSHTDASVPSTRWHGHTCTRTLQS